MDIIVNSYSFAEIEDKLKSLIPDVRFEWVLFMEDTIQEILEVSMTDKTGETSGFCFLVIYKASKRYSTILYIYINEDLRGQGLGIKFLKEALKELDSRGYLRVLTAVTEDDKSELLVKAGLRYYIEGAYLIYSGAELKKSKMGQNLDKFMPHIKRVCSIEEMDPEIRKEFRRKILNRIYSTDIESSDKYLTRCYLDSDGKIAGGISFTKNGNRLMMTDWYFTKTKDAGFTIPSVISSLLVSDVPVILDDTSVNIYCESKKHEEAMRKAFGEPERIIREQLFMR